MPTRTEVDAQTLKIIQLNYHHSHLYDGKIVDYNGSADLNNT